MVGENQQTAMCFPFPEGAGDESAVCAPYSANKVVRDACHGQFGWQRGKSSRPIGDEGLFFYPFYKRRCNL